MRSSSILSLTDTTGAGVGAARVTGGGGGDFFAGAGGGAFFSSCNYGGVRQGLK